MEGSKITREEHYRHVAKFKGHVEELQLPKIPRSLRYLLDWFYELHSGRQSGGFGVAPLSWVDIKAWAELQRIRPNSWELKLIKKMDKAYMEAVND